MRVSSGCPEGVLRVSSGCPEGVLDEEIEQFSTTLRYCPLRPSTDKNPALQEDFIPTSTKKKIESFCWFPSFRDFVFFRIFLLNSVQCLPFLTAHYS